MKKTIDRMPAEIQTNALADSSPNSRYLFFSEVETVLECVFTGLFYFF